MGKRNNNLRHLRQAEVQTVERKSTHPKATLVSMSQEIYAGPLPHPDTLARYEQILPGSAERVFLAFEKQTEG